MKGDRFSGYVYDGDEGIRFSNNEEELILFNIKRILKARKGERLTEPNFGSSVRNFLFLPNIQVDDLLAVIKNDIETQEPRAKVNSITIVPTGKELEDILTINVNLTIKTSEGDIKTTLDTGI